MMTDDKKYCREVLHKVEEMGAKASVEISRQRMVDITFRSGRPEVVKEAARVTLNMNIYKDGRYTSQTTPDLRPEALNAFIVSALENTGFIEEDPFRTLPPAELTGIASTPDMLLADPGHISLTPENRRKLAYIIEQEAIKHGGPRVISVESGMSDSETSSTIMASNGFEGKTRFTSYWTGATVSLQDEGNRKPSSGYWVGARHLADLPAPDETGRMAAHRSLQLLGAKKIKSETLPIIIENRAVPSLLRGFLNGLYGSNIQQKRSFLADKQGVKVGSGLFTLTDAPFLQKGFGSRLFDDDGLVAKSIVLVENGVINDFYVDWYYSRKLNCPPTTGRPSNLIFPKGDKPLTSLMKMVGRGILVTGFIGGNSNPATGDFSIGIIGSLFDNGEPIQPVAEMNIAGNHLTFWEKLVAVGNDPWVYSSWVTPSVLLDQVVVAGI